MRHVQKLLLGGQRAKDQMQKLLDKSSSIAIANAVNQAAATLRTEPGFGGAAMAGGGGAGAGGLRGLDAVGTWDWRTGSETTEGGLSECASLPYSAMDSGGSGPLGVIS
jgi:hypothetical protein